MGNFTLLEIANYIDGTVYGDSGILINGIDSIQDATTGKISFLSSNKLLKYLPDTKASAVVVRQQDMHLVKTTAIVCKDPYVAYAKLSKLFYKEENLENTIHPTAVIYPNVTIGHGVTIGENSIIYPNVSIYNNVTIGKRAIIHSGVVIGSDGFGMANENGKWIKIYHLGGVIIGDDVEIGANTTIDRGALSNTIIGNGVKLDNQIQVAHNVEIGHDTAIAGCTAIAGSAKIGAHCMIGGGVCIAGHLEITDQVIITGMSGVDKSIDKPGMYSSGIPAMPSKIWWKKLAKILKKF